MPRDDFSPRDIETLRSRVAGHCSNPDCDKLTIGPAGDLGVNRIGVAAHIHAAAPGGPRYLASMTSKERASLSNGIWLCNNCSRDIDNDTERYPGDLLREWKRKAEAKARERIGKPPVTDASVQQQMGMLLGAAPASFQFGAVANVHSALASSLEKLDPRFRVETAHGNGETYVGLHARETVPMRMRAQPGFGEDFKGKLCQLFEHGDAVAFDASNVSIEGSPLFARLSPEAGCGRIELTPLGVPAVLKMKAAGGDGPVVVEEFRGKLKAGLKTFSFLGTACDGLVTFEVRRALIEHDPEADFSALLNDEVWTGADVRWLPYFENVYEVFAAMALRRELGLQLLANGLRIFGARLLVNEGDPYVNGIHNALSYLRRARALAEGLGVEVHYAPAYPFSAEQHMELHRAVEILEGRLETSADPNVITTLTVSCPDALAQLSNRSSALGLVQIRQGQGDLLDVYGQEVRLPSLEVALTNVVPEVLSERELPEGRRELAVAWRPLEGFHCRYNYLSGQAASGEGAHVEVHARQA